MWRKKKEKENEEKQKRVKVFFYHADIYLNFFRNRTNQDSCVQNELALF